MSARSARTTSSTSQLHTTTGAVVEDADVTFGGITPGAIHEGDVIPGASPRSLPIHFGTTAGGAFTGTGPAALYATFGSVSKALTPAVPARTTGTVIAI